MVQMNNVRKVYESSNTVALDGVSLTINDGEFVFLVGPSGSGKTTIMKLITGEVRPTSGQIIVNDFDMGTIKRRKLPKVRRTLGVIFQDYRLIENMNVYDNVAFAMRVVGAANSEIKKRVPYILELVGLEGRGKRMPNELSGGEQQRVAIARALVNSPRMIVADEPTGNLDPVRSLELMLLFEKINEMGTTVMVVTHEKELVNAFSKRVITIDGGNLIHSLGCKLRGAKWDYSEHLVELGKKASHGCVRMDTRMNEQGLNAYWVWTHIPYYTKVLVIDDPQARAERLAEINAPAATQTPAVTDAPAASEQPEASPDAAVSDTPAPTADFTPIPTAEPTATPEPHYTRDLG